MKVLVTGAAGFIGYHIVRRLLGNSSVSIVGIDNLNGYYDVSLKYNRLKECGINKISETDLIQSKKYEAYRFIKHDISDFQSLKLLFEEQNFDIVINMAAQAGVRNSEQNYMAYVQSNMVGFANILECSRLYQIKHLIYASSSSIYGINNKIPYSENDNVDYPVSFYAATKKSDELMAHTYSHLYKLPVTGLRLFTVYGPWGRPDMAPMLFSDAIYAKKPVRVFNNGEMLRDFTYIDDVTECVCRIISQIPGAEQEHPYYQILNVGNSNPVNLLDFIKTLEREIGISAELEMYPMQASDVKDTYADISRLNEYIGYYPNTSLELGLKRFIEWYKEYYCNC